MECLYLRGRVVLFHPPSSHSATCGDIDTLLQITPPSPLYNEGGGVELVSSLLWFTFHDKNQVENLLQKLPGHLDWLDPLFITMTTATIMFS